MTSVYPVRTSILRGLAASTLGRCTVSTPSAYSALMPAGVDLLADLERAIKIADAVLAEHELGLALVPRPDLALNGQHAVGEIDVDRVAA